MPTPATTHDFRSAPLLVRAKGSSAMRDAPLHMSFSAGGGRVKLEDELLDVGPLDSIREAPTTARAFEAGPDGLEFLAFGPYHPGDGEPVEDPWTDQ
jgi:hypothetical protein